MMIDKRICGIMLLFSIGTTLSMAQSYVSVEGGYLQSIFYSSQMKSDYYYSFSQYPSFYVNATYKEDVPQWSKNMRIGGQIGWKRQVQWFYYEDRYPQDTFATGVRYDIHSVNIYLFPEIAVGEKIKFYFSGGPQLQIICNTSARGKQVKVISGQEYPETEINNTHSKDVKGVCLGAKICLGMEIPLYKGLILNLNNAYSAGFTGMRGEMQPRLKFFNCIDIYLGAGLTYKIEHKSNKNT